MIYMKKIFTAVLLMFLQGVQQVLDMNFSNLQKLVKLNLNKSETESGYEI